jgi:hypothetical protein
LYHRSYDQHDHCYTIVQHYRLLFLLRLIVLTLLNKTNKCDTCVFSRMNVLTILNLKQAFIPVFCFCQDCGWISNSNNRFEKPVLKTAQPSFDRWLYLLLVALAIGLMACDAASRFAIVDAATRVQTRDVPLGPQAASTTERIRNTVLPSTALDARWWVIHTERGLKEGRIRFTAQDNSPHGREVHWSSGPVWLLGGIARVIALFSGTAALEEVQRAPLWFGPIAFVLLATLVTALIAPRFGWGYAGFLILLYATSIPVYEAFRAGDADHHGLSLIFALGCVLGLVCGGAGWSVTKISKTTGQKNPVPIPTSTNARKYFIVSAICGAAGMWISAATMIPVLASCGLAAIAAAWLVPESKVSANPALWRLWGFWGVASARSPVDEGSGPGPGSRCKIQRQCRRGSVHFFPAQREGADGRRRHHCCHPVGRGAVEPAGRNGVPNKI